MMLLSRILFVLPFAVPMAQETEPRFPPAAPAEVGMDAGQLEELAGFVRGLTESGEIVGAELLVIRNDKTVLQRAFGWKDREEQVAMEPNTIFCVRSMTKPVVGTAIEMLVDAKQLALADKVSKYLPSFDNERSRDITVEMLLHHKGGLPLSSLLDQDLSELTSIREVADETGQRGPEHPPGKRFSYSDDGADTLGALVEVVSGDTFDAFVQHRILDPLGMHESLPIVGLDRPERARIASNYAGAPGSWTRYWSPKDPPLFPVLLASQALYASPRDYARFLALWKDKGLSDGKRVLSMKAIRRGLAPGVETGMPTGFGGLSVEYGDMWQLWVDRAQHDKPRVVAFGHGGSDGTFAWCFPELDLMVLYFTQSRGTLSGLAFEEALQEHVLDALLKSERAPNAKYTDAELDALGGEYWNTENQQLLELSRRKDELRAEFPGRGNIELAPTPERDRFVIALSPKEAFVIERDEAGQVRSITVQSQDPSGGDVAVLFEPLVAEQGLPSVDELETLRKRTCDWDKLAALGTCRLSGTVTMPARKMSGTYTNLASGTRRFRSEIDLGDMQIRVACDGERAWTFNTRTGLQEVTDVMLAQARLDQPFRRIASLREFFPKLRVLKALDFQGRRTYLLRGEPAGAGPRSLYVDAETGRLVAEAFVPLIPNLGELGIWIDYDDWRAVEGIELPFRVSLEYASPLLGTTVSVLEKLETNVDAPESSFRLDEGK